jgi:hypothetical protein
MVSHFIMCDFSLGKKLVYISSKPDVSLYQNQTQVNMCACSLPCGIETCNI